MPDTEQFDVLMIDPQSIEMVPKSSGELNRVVAFTNGLPNDHGMHAQIRHGRLRRHPGADRVKVAQVTPAYFSKDLFAQTRVAYGTRPLEFQIQRPPGQDGEAGAGASTPTAPHHSRPC